VGEEPLVAAVPYLSMPAIGRTQPGSCRTWPDNALGPDYHVTLRTRLRARRLLAREAPGPRAGSMSTPARSSSGELAARAGLGWFGRHQLILRGGDSYVCSASS